MTAWHVEFFNENVAAEVNGLPTDIRAKFLQIAEMMIAVGPQQMREPHVKLLRDKLWEMRMSGEEGIGRPIYILASNRRIMVLHAFVKKTQKTSPQAIQLALQERRRFCHDSSLEETQRRMDEGSCLPVGV